MHTAVAWHIRRPCKDLFVCLFTDLFNVCSLLHFPCFTEDFALQTGITPCYGMFSKKNCILAKLLNRWIGPARNELLSKYFAMHFGTTIYMGLWIGFCHPAPRFLAKPLLSYSTKIPMMFVCESVLVLSIWLHRGRSTA